MEPRARSRRTCAERTRTPKAPPTSHSSVGIAATRGTPNSASRPTWTSPLLTRRSTSTACSRSCRHFRRAADSSGPRQATSACNGGGLGAALVLSGAEARVRAWTPKSEGLKVTFGPCPRAKEPSRCSHEHIQARTHTRPPDPLPRWPCRVSEVPSARPAEHGDDRPGPRLECAHSHGPLLGLQHLE